MDLVGDVVTEAASAGTDTVKTGLDRLTLAANVENLAYTGTGDFAGTGNASPIQSPEGVGNDTLNGGDGSDTLIGGKGNDFYIVDSAGDAVIENAGEGIDQVQTSLANYTLGENIENLGSDAAGFGAFIGTGNALDNRIMGSFAGSNTLTGGAGDDVLFGGIAADFFVYEPNWGHDTIMNFEVAGGAHDTIRIDHTIFADWASLLAVSTLSGNDTIITADADNTITLKNVAVSSLQSADFNLCELRSDRPDRPSRREEWAGVLPQLKGLDDGKGSSLKPGTKVATIGSRDGRLNSRSITVAYLSAVRIHGSPLARRSWMTAASIEATLLTLDIVVAGCDRRGGCLCSGRNVGRFQWSSFWTDCSGGAAR